MFLKEILSKDELTGVGYPYAHKNVFWSFLRKIALEYLKQNYKGRILDAAAQDFKMRDTFRGLEGLEYFGLDYDPVSLNKAVRLKRIQPNDRLILMDLTASFDDLPSFDLVFSSNTLTQIPDSLIWRALHNLIHMTAPDGIFVFNVQSGRVSAERILEFHPGLNIEEYRIHSLPDKIINGETVKDFNAQTFEKELNAEQETYGESCYVVRHVGGLSTRGLNQNNEILIRDSEKIIRIGRVRSIMRRHFNGIETLFDYLSNRGAYNIFIFSDAMSETANYSAMLEYEIRRRTELATEALELRVLSISKALSRLNQLESIFSAQETEIVFLGYEDRFVDDSERERHLFNEFSSLVDDYISFSVLTIENLEQYKDMKPSYLARHR